MTTTAMADYGLPPVRFDIGGQTEAQVIRRMHLVFGPDMPELIGLPEKEVMGQCDAIQLHRYGQHYPAAETAGGGILVGCLIRDLDHGRPVIVYSVDPKDPFYAAQILRHEVGHHLGWSHTHRRD
jgi:hypothetical protein